MDWSITTHAPLHNSVHARLGWYKVHVAKWLHVHWPVVDLDLVLGRPVQTVLVLIQQGIIIIINTYASK